MGLTISTPIIDLHNYGIGKLSALTARKLAVAVAGVAAKVDVNTVTVEDLLNYYPARYEDRSNFISIDKLEEGMEAAVEIYVRGSGGKQVGRNRDPRKPPLFIFEITGGDAERLCKPVVVKWFISGRSAKAILEYYTERFARGTRFVAYGLWEFDERKGTFALKLAKPDELEILPALGTELFPDKAAKSKKIKRTPDENDELDEDIASPEFATVHTARRVPVYRKLGPFQTKRLREIVHSVLAKLDRGSIADGLPLEVRDRHSLITRADAVADIHFPPESSTIAEYEMFRSAAQRRLIFDEFFWLTFSMQLLRGGRRRETKTTVIEVSEAMKGRLKNITPFALTGAQKRVVGEVFGDLKSGSMMNRLIQGDVGSGKTIVAFLAIFAVMENGYQTALMAPTEILAEQHFRNAVKLFADTGYRVELLVGSTRAAQKRKIHADLAAGDIDLVIGTHAIIQDAVSFDRLALAVIDEQHRFGVLQRAQLTASGMNPDILVMTATPIPRSLAMTVYGDLDVSIIDELPPGRTPIKTVVVGEDKREGVYQGIKREIKLGRQVYIVYPLIEESEKLDLKAATIMYDDLRLNRFPQYTVGLLHGKMKSADKEEIMREFVAGRLDILVSTTVIEVGVDVPNASLMIIEHAERFGLSQLHQLRGRVGRGADQSFCVLLTDFKKTAVAKQRLGIMEATSDGFKIAEKDLEIRGQGEILGTRQSGLQSFKLGNIVRDLDILIAARSEAETFLNEHPDSEATRTMIRIARTDKKVRLGTIA
ncbi:MAG: ATP-dependent DNA helicase RecG [Chloracidobacterium sp.]|nr:ATP-dependent DNA helicase RecG [Chloracidobacterium sp.]MBK9437614.1 ATP-dependent DNA helicase RecG [Chloracidobacterium sp.]